MIERVTHDSTDNNLMNFSNYFLLDIEAPSVDLNLLDFTGLNPAKWDSHKTRTQFSREVSFFPITPHQIVIGLLTNTINLCILLNLRAYVSKLSIVMKITSLIGEII